MPPCPSHGQSLGGEARVVARRQQQHVRRQHRRRLRWDRVLLRHLDLGQREIGAPVVGLEEVDIPVEAAVRPRVAHLLQGLLADLPQPFEIDRRDLGFDFDHLVVDRTLVAEDMTRPAGRFDGADAQARGVEIGLPQMAPRDAGRGRQAALERGVAFEDKLAFVFDRHAL